MMIAEILHWFKTRTWLKCPNCGHRICPLSITQGNYFWSPHYLKPICGDCVKDVLDAKFPKQETAITGSAPYVSTFKERTGKMKEKPHTLIQSYVLDKFFVSTAYRQSSAAVSNPPWYYETIIWEWDKETNKLGCLLNTIDSGSGAIQATKNHAGICVRLVTERTADPDADGPKEKQGNIAEATGGVKE